MTHSKGTKTYYDVLELPYEASMDEVQDGYVRAKNAYSGDEQALYSLLTEEETREILDEIETAYSILSDPYKRFQYDEEKGHNEELRKKSNNPATAYTQGSSPPQGAGVGASWPKQSSAQVASPAGGLSPNSSPQMMATDHSVAASKQSYNQVQDLKRSNVEVSRLAAVQRFKLDFQRDPDFEELIAKTTIFTGDFLRQIREYKNVTIERLSDLTKISKTYLRSIESEELDKLPAKAYLRGFVYQYAKCLKLGPDLVASSYIHHVMKGREKDS